MPIPLTIYNCGTGYNSTSSDIVAQLHRETQSVKHINDGPGSGSVNPFKGDGPGGKLKIAGMVRGAGVDANVDAAVTEVRRRARHWPPGTGMVVNMCGWSRGAVTCFKIANKLHDDPETSHIKVNIFAIDPVPGGVANSNHMWQNIGLSDNVVACSVVLAQHDRRKLFAPVYPTANGPFTDVDVMPGDHSTIVESTGERTEAHQLVYDMAKRFLGLRGTLFSYAPLSSGAVLNLYARIAAQFDDYASAGKGAGKVNPRRLKIEDSRPVYTDAGTEMGRMLPTQPAFFLNEHHRQTCRLAYPRIVNEIDLPPREAFALGRSSTWKPELDKMKSDTPAHAEILESYILLCGSARSRAAARASY